MTLDISFYEAAAQIIPVFMLAMLVEGALLNASVRTNPRLQRTHQRMVAAFTVVALVGLAMSLTVMASQWQHPSMAASTMLGLGASISAALFFNFERLDQIGLARLQVVAVLPFCLSALVAIGFLFADLFA